MSRGNPMVPNQNWGVIDSPEQNTQFGCVYCLSEGLEAPASQGVIYFYGGSSVCADHMRSTIFNQG